MTVQITKYAVAFYFIPCLLLNVGLVNMMPAVDQDLVTVHYEEYYIEHEISVMQARNSVSSFDYDPVSQPPGCHPCSLEEKRYCLSTDLVNDHCCCDKRYLEVLPYIPHTCYFGTQLCTPVASDCTEYRRLRSCCCDTYLFENWKEKLEKSTASRSSALLLLIIFIVLVVYQT